MQKLEVNCATGQAQLVTLSADEEQALTQAKQQAQARQDEREQRRAQSEKDRSALKSRAADPANTDPIWQVIARLLGAV